LFGGYLKKKKFLWVSSPAGASPGAVRGANVLPGSAASAHEDTRHEDRQYTKENGGLFLVGSTLGATRGAVFNQRGGGTGPCPPGQPDRHF